MKKIVRSIDVGYGHTKFVTESLNGQISCGIFPSIAPIVTNLSLLDAVGSVDIAKIEIGSITRVVGKDVANFTSAISTRIMDDTYSSSDIYMSLTRGAMSYMGRKNIDILILGLPVSLYKNNEIRARLTKIMAGFHTISKDLLISHKVQPPSESALVWVV